MSTVVLNYTRLEDAAKQAEKAHDEIGDYIDELKAEVTSKIDKLPGSDTLGYASAASEAIKSKINELVAKQEKLTKYKTAMDNFITEAKTRDGNASNSIESTADAVIGKRTFFQSVGDYLYNNFCVDFASSNEIVRHISEFCRKGYQKVDCFVEKARDWFKYGDGQYVWNALKAVGASIAVAAAWASAIGKAAVAVAAVIATGGAALPLAILALAGLAASTASAYITIKNSLVSIENNGKALNLSIKENNPAAARYYGEINSQSEYYKRTDMGNLEENQSYAEKGETLDKVDTIAGLVSMGTGILDLGIGYDYSKAVPALHTDGWSLKNFRYNFNHQAGYHLMHTDNGYEYLLSDDGLKVTSNIFKEGKIIKNMTKIIESVEGIRDFTKLDNPTLTDAGDVAENVIDLLGFSDFYDSAFKYGYGTVKTIYNAVCN